MEDHNMDPRMERIIRYVEDDLAPAERKAVELELEGDPELQEIERSVRRSIMGLHALGEEQLRRQLKEAEHGAKRSGWSALRGRGVWAAAAAVALVFVGIWWVVARPASDAALADRFSLPEPGLPVLMNTRDRALDEVMNAYKEGHFEIALGLLALGSEADPENDTLRYFTGVVQTSLGAMAEAEQAFAQVPEGSAFAHRARYQQAILALRTSDRQRSITLLSPLVEVDDGAVASRSRRLLDRLK